MMKPKTARNEAAYALHMLDPKKYSAAFLARKYKITPQTMHEIIVREKAKRGDSQAKSLSIVRAKYPSLSTGK